MREWALTFCNILYYFKVNLINIRYYIVLYNKCVSPCCFSRALKYKMNFFSQLSKATIGPHRLHPHMEWLLQRRVESTPVGRALTGGVTNKGRVECCGPYSVMVKQILCELGIHSTYVLSTCWDYRASANVPHAFVVFCLGGKWYQCDPTMTQFLDEPLTCVGMDRVTPTIISPITDPTALRFLNKNIIGGSNKDCTTIPFLPLDESQNSLVAELLKAQQAGIPGSSIVSKKALSSQLFRAIPPKNHEMVTDGLSCIFGDSQKSPSP